MEKFGEFLASRRKKLTGERRTIVAEVFAAHEHFDAEELVAKLQRHNGERVSRSTVYRTLAQLVEAGLLRKARHGNRDVYEQDYGYPQHDHLCCQRCGKLIEFQSAPLAAIRDEVSRRHQFHPLSHRFVIYGTCAECNLSRVSRRRLDLV
ncbi:MAG: transcriptional repressor [Planctomycetes bacterium]|nr:transcriptional repressor [Planctomycetota bacterium]